MRIKHALIVKVALLSLVLTMRIFYRFCSHRFNRYSKTSATLCYHRFHNSVGRESAMSLIGVRIEMWLGVLVRR
jgi:hypothetical protein